MITGIASRLGHKAAANMIILFAGRSSAVLVGFVFLPLYSKVLGPEQFGTVAVIMSLQALLVMLDFGMSALVTREVASAESSQQGLLKLIRRAELALSGFYLLLAVVAAVWFTGHAAGMSPLAVLSAVVLFWVLVLQNVYYSAMLAHRQYVPASTLQIAGVTIRAVATAYVLEYFSATVEAFITVQLLVGALHYYATRRACSRMFPAHTQDAGAGASSKVAECLGLLRRGGGLAVFSIAGAAVTQLDKPIVSTLVSAADVTPYFLATTLCMVPISVLAGPVSQYFQPRLLNAVAHERAEHAQGEIMRFALVLLLVIGVPTICLWLFRVPVINLWLAGGANNAVIARYVEILLPGVALGALGFIPYGLLLSAKDFGFQAALSAALTIITLAAAAVLAARQNVAAVCAVYALYHATSTLLSWGRAMRLPSTRNLARSSAVLTLKALVIVIVLTAISTYIT